MLVRQLIRDGHNARIFRDDALPHLIQRCLSLNPGSIRNVHNTGIEAYDALAR